MLFDCTPKLKISYVAMWLSAKRKELMCVFARYFHYVVMAKHQLVAKALK